LVAEALPLEVRDRRVQRVDTVLEMTEAQVAVRAQKAAHTPGKVIVVDTPSASTWI
jgi:hypothetical protein